MGIMSFGSAGISQETPQKLEDFKYIMEAHVPIVRGIVDRWSFAHPDYHYFDMTAGPGWYPQPGIGAAGSPLIALHNLRVAGPGYRAWLFEENHKTASKLLRAMDARGFDRDLKSVVIGNSSERLPAILRGITGASYRDGLKPFGMAYMDPNGPGDLDFDALRMFGAKRLQCIDILIYASASSYLRCLKAKHCRQYNRRFMEEVRTLGRTNILLRDMKTSQNWTFVLLTNWKDFPRFRRIGFHSIETAEGRDIAERLNFTRQELKVIRARHEQMGLFPDGV